MDKLQAILSVSQIIVIDADASDELSISRSLPQFPKQIHFVRSENLKKDSFTDSFANYFFILRANDTTDIKQKLYTMELEQRSVAILAEKNLSRDKVDSSLFILNPNDIAISFLQFWEKQLRAAVEYEVKHAKSCPIFHCIEETLELPEGNSEARARLAFALATQLTVDLSQIRRVVRLALYYPILALDDWREQIHSKKELVELIPLLEQKLLVGRISLENICPQDLSIELVMVESAIFAQKHIGERESKFRSELKIFSSQLPFKVRTQIRNSAERCFKYLWSENEVA